MPELPEVETTCRGISPHITGKTITDIHIRQGKLRWPVPDNIAQQFRGQIIQSVSRRAKYILLETNRSETIIIHLGMSGNLRILSKDQKPGKHDHVDFVFSDGYILRFNDTRRFGSILCTSKPINQHKLIHKLGPEPLSDQFSGSHLYTLSRNKKMPVKSFVMNGLHVAGVGNIYASESLFMAGIHPSRQAGNISLKRYQKLASFIKIVLQQSIDQGGTTLRDFVNEEGKPGYFQQSLAVYAREGDACTQCATPIKQMKIAQRSSFYCSYCQK